MKAQQRPRPVRVFLVDDHRLFLSGVQSELADRCAIVGTATDVDSAVSGIRASRPEVVLLDVHLPGGGGRSVIEQVHGEQVHREKTPGRQIPGKQIPGRQIPGAEDASAQQAPGAVSEVRFLALSVSDAPEDVIAVVRAGARGYVTKTITPDALADAIVRVRDGDAVFSPRLAGFVLDAFSGDISEPADPELDQLTAREREVLRHIARGYTYKQVGKQLHISVKTVETHVSAVLRKLQLSSRYELTRWASDRRLI